MNIVELRDRFAMAAMQSLLITSPVSYAEEKREDETNAQLNYIAIESYRVADAMLQERKMIKPEQN